MRVVVADDSTLLREGVVRLLQEAGLEVVGQAADGEDLLRKVRAHKPDVAVVDVRMPPTHTDEGLRAAREIRDELPDVGVLVLSQYVEVAYVRELLAESAEGLGYGAAHLVGLGGEAAAIAEAAPAGGPDPETVRSARRASRGAAAWLAVEAWPTPEAYVAWARARGLAIATLDVAITPATPGGLQLVSAAADGARAVLWLGGGRAGTTYAVTLTLGTRAGRTLARTVLLPVLLLTAPAPGSETLQTEAGDPVQDDSGQPLIVGA